MELSEEWQPGKQRVQFQLAESSNFFMTIASMCAADLQP